MWVPTPIFDPTFSPALIDTPRYVPTFASFITPAEYHKFLLQDQLLLAPELQLHFQIPVQHLLPIS